MPGNFIHLYNIAQNKIVMNDDISLGLGYGIQKIAGRRRSIKDHTRRDIETKLGSYGHFADDRA